jgi:hypothetical protein
MRRPFLLRWTWHKESFRRSDVETAGEVFTFDFDLRERGHAPDLPTG